MPPSQAEFDRYERECVVAACGSDPMHPREMVHSHTSASRYGAFCKQYGSCPWPPHAGAKENLAQPEFCQLKIMAIAAESCPVLQPAYRRMYGRMLAGVEIQPVVQMKREPLPVSDDFSLNTLIHDMQLDGLSVSERTSIHQVVRSTYAISSCASASYPPVRDGVGCTMDALYPLAFQATATTAIHLACYKLLLLRGGGVANGGASTQMPLPTLPPLSTPHANVSDGGGGFGDGGFGDNSTEDDERLRFGDILEEIAGGDEMDMEAQQELKMMAGMAMAQMDRKRKYTRPRDDLGGRIYTHVDRDAMEAAITKCMHSQKKQNGKRMRA
jgi:hypothetical protein